MPSRDSAQVAKWEGSRPKDVASGADRARCGRAQPVRLALGSFRGVLRQRPGGGFCEQGARRDGGRRPLRSATSTRARKHVSLRLMTTQGLRRFFVRATVTLGLAAVCAGLLAASTRVSPSVLSTTTPVVGIDVGKEPLASAARRRLQTALGQLRVASGRYPTSLQELVRAGFLTERDLRFPFEEPWAYRVSVAQDRYDLVPPLR